MAIVRSFQCWPRRFVCKSARYQADFFMINSYIFRRVKAASPASDHDATVALMINSYIINKHFFVIALQLLRLISRCEYILLGKPHSNHRALFQYRASLNSLSFFFLNNLIYLPCLKTYSIATKKRMCAFLKLCLACQCLV